MQDGYMFEEICSFFLSLAVSNILAKGVTCNHSNADGLTPLHRVSRLLYLMYIYYVLKSFNCNQMNSNESSVITLQALSHCSRFAG